LEYRVCIQNFNGLWDPDYWPIRIEKKFMPVLLKGPDARKFYIAKLITNP